MMHAILRAHNFAKWLNNPCSLEDLQSREKSRSGRFMTCEFSRSPWWGTSIIADKLASIGLCKNYPQGRSLTVVLKKEIKKNPWTPPCPKPTIQGMATATLLAVFYFEPQNYRPILTLWAFAWWCGTTAWQFMQFFGCFYQVW